MKIGCAILAGGKSSRMGKDKALLEINGRDFISQLMITLDFFEEKMIARGNNSDIKNDSWCIIPDIYPECGPISGLHASLSICKSDALFFVTCDMPLIQKSLVNYLCDNMSDKYDALIVKDENGRIHPLCGIYKKYTVEIFEKQILSKNNRIMCALDKMNVKYVTIDSLEESQQLYNVNTPQDYLKLKK